MDAWRTIIYGLIVLGIIGAVIVPKAVSKKFERDFEDCRGLSAAAIITAAIAAAYWYHNDLRKFITSPEMMVVATTVAFEVFYAYCMEKGVATRTRVYVSVLSGVIVMLGGWRAYAAITEEFGPTPHEVPPWWVFFLQAVIWLAAFGVAFPAKVLATRAKEKPKQSQTEPAVPEVAKTGA